jgi:hypothetical protein
MAMGKFNITTTTQGRSIFSRPKEGNKGSWLDQRHHDVLLILKALTVIAFSGLPDFSCSAIYCCRFMWFQLLYLMISLKNDKPNISEKWTLGCSWSCCGCNHCRLFRNQPSWLVAAVVALAFGLAAASLFYHTWDFDKKMNKEGAIADYRLYWCFSICWNSNLDFWWKSWLVRISPEGFGTIAMIVNFVVAFTVKSLEPPKMFKILNTLDSFWCRRPTH